ncbi:limonene cyclase [Bacillus sp. NH11B]|uniref:limonene cyclase n=1 Tax=Bacillus sp. NH11B TaxID=1866314 RepID=UPI0020C864AA|nr:limonene cyclase [Bacillus sp. NH11B]
MDMNIHDKFKLERRIFNRLIEHNRKNGEPDSTAVILAYEHGLQVLEEMYKTSQQEEKEEIAPF